MKKVVVLFIIVLGLASMVFAAKGDEALTSLKKFQSRCEVGISYVEYAGALANVQYQVKEYFENNDEGVNPNLEFAKCIVGALADYRAAGILWHLKVALKYDDITCERDDNALWLHFANLYPHGVQAVITEYREATGSGGRCIYFPSMLSYIWEQAGQKIAKASKLMNDRPTRKSKK